MAGGALGKKPGGELMVAGSVLTLIGGTLLFGGFLGVLPFILMLVGGVLALREKAQVAPKIE